VAEEQKTQSGALSGGTESNLIREIGANVDNLTLQDTVVLSGFLRSANDGYWRLYLTLGFTEYLDFQESDYVHHVHSTASPLGVTYVWGRSFLEWAN
jgi:hypothetical protein